MISLAFLDTVVPGGENVRLRDFGVHICLWVCKEWPSPPCIICCLTILSFPFFFRLTFLSLVSPSLLRFLAPLYFVLNVFHTCSVIWDPDCFWLLYLLNHSLFFLYFPRALRTVENYCASHSCFILPLNFLTKGILSLTDISQLSLIEQTFMSLLFDSYCASCWSYRGEYMSYWI